MNSGTALAGSNQFHKHDKGNADDRRHRWNVAYEIETEFVVERRVDRISIGDKEKRIAVRRCIHDRLGADIAAATRAIVEQMMGWPSRSDSRCPTKRATISGALPSRLRRQYSTHRPCRIGLRRSGSR